MITEPYAYIPFKRPTADGQEFIDILKGKKHSSRVPLVEYIGIWGHNTYLPAASAIFRARAPEG